MFPPRPSMRLVRDTIAFCAAEMPRWHPISISGYHIREAGSTAAEELAFTLANGFAYVELALQAGLAGRRVRAAAVVLLQRAHRLLRGDRQVPRRPAHLGPLDARALRRRRPSGRCSCASTPRPPACRSPRSSPRSTSCAPRSRRWPACSAARRACTPTRWTRRSRCRPRRRPASRCARSRCIAYETHVAQRRRPARRLVVRRGAHRRDGAPGRGRSSPTSTSSATARCSRACISGIEEGLVPGPRSPTRPTSSSASSTRAAASSSASTASPRATTTTRSRLLEITNEDEARQLKRLDAVRHDRDQAAVDAALARCGARPPIPRTNLMPALIDAVSTYATLGEIMDALADVFGRHVEVPTI